MIGASTNGPTTIMTLAHAPQAIALGVKNAVKSAAYMKLHAAAALKSAWAVGPATDNSDMSA